MIILWDLFVKGARETTLIFKYTLIKTHHLQKFTTPSTAPLSPSPCLLFSIFQNHAVGGVRLRGVGEFTL